MSAKQDTTTIPLEAITCLALIKPQSEIASRWDLGKPTYCIYQYSPAFGTRKIRFGDGSGASITDEEHNDLILLPAFGDKEIDALFA